MPNPERPAGEVLFSGGDLAELSENQHGPQTGICGKARYIMVGGFLGAGKTTAIAKLARRLTDVGLRVGLITNDQGRNLVDTAMLRAQGFATEEIPGGCFCCRFNSLIDAAAKLTALDRPDVFIAEPVGSCTDLAATVTYPLRRIYGGRFSVAPVSVLVDPVRAARVFGLEPGGSFSRKVLYIYLKQIEEADVAVISKCDLVDVPRLQALREAILSRFPGKHVLAVSARNGTNLDDWFDHITSVEQAAQSAMNLDYPLYADGEGLLGWLNSTVRLTAGERFDADLFLQRLAAEIQRRLVTGAAEVAHLKMTFSPDASFAGEISVVNLVRNDFVPELGFRLGELARDGQLIINLRAEADPDFLAGVMRESLATTVAEFASLQSRIEHLEHFRPGTPIPTHRFARPAD